MFLSLFYDIKAKWLLKANYFTFFYNGKITKLYFRISGSLYPKHIQTSGFISKNQILFQSSQYFIFIKKFTFTNINDNIIIYSKHHLFVLEGNLCNGISTGIFHTSTDTNLKGLLFLSLFHEIDITGQLLSLCNSLQQRSLNLLQIYVQ